MLTAEKVQGKMTTDKYFPHYGDMYIYIYIHRERESEKEITSMYNIYIYIYIHMFNTTDNNDANHKPWFEKVRGRRNS